MTSAQTPLGVESTLPDHTQLAEDQFVWVRSRFLGSNSNKNEICEVLWNNFYNVR